MLEEAKTLSKIRNRRLLGFCALFFSLIASSAVYPQSEVDNARNRLEAIVTELAAREKARAALSEAERNAESEAKRLSEELITLGLRVRAAEADALRLETQIEALESEVSSKNVALDQRRGELTDLFSALTTLSRRPPVLALLKPGEATTTARSTAVMGRLVPMIKERAESLAADIQDLATIKRSLSQERFALKNTLERLATDEIKLENGIRRRSQEAARARADLALQQEQLNRLAAEADDLRDLLANLEAAAAERAEAARRRGLNPRTTPPAGFSGRRFESGRGTLPSPLAGAVIRRFGDRDGAGTAKGLTIKGRAGAQAIAPFEGQVVFAGPYRGYGRLVIIAHGDGYHSLLAGLDRLYGEAGQWVLAGEPVGTVPSGGSNAGELYLELRSGGSPINPKNWLRQDTLTPFKEAD